MDISAPSVREAGSSALAKRAAFSLVEVTLAIGIVAFAFIGVLGMIPTGLNTFRRSMDISVGTQIADRIINEAEQTDFGVLTTNSGGTTGAGGMFQQVNPSPSLPGKSVRYFDDQGNEITTPSAIAGALYQVNTLITPTTVTPCSSASQPPEATNASLATVIVQVANNPGNRTIGTDPTTTLLWSDSTVSIATYTGLVSKNK